MSQLYYSGTVFVAAGLLAGLTVIIVLAIFRWESQDLRRLCAANVWVLCGFIVFLLALGDRTPLWQWLCRLPVFDKFNHPFKFLPFLTLFLVLGGGLFLERAIPKGTSGRTVTGSVAAIVAALLMYHCGLAQSCFYPFSERPYPLLSAPLAAVLHDDGGQSRAWSIAPLRSPSRDYVSSLNLNFATVYQVLALNGYDPLVAAGPEFRHAYDRLKATPLDACQAYGVRWLIVHRLATKPEYGPIVSFAQAERLSIDLKRALAIVGPAGYPVLKLPEVTVLELSHVAPLAFAEAAPGQALPLRVTGAGADVDVSAVTEGGNVVVNFLLRPETVVTVDGQMLAASADDWGRIVVPVPAAAQRLEVRHVPPWRQGFLLAMILGGAAAGLFWLQNSGLFLSKPVQMSSERIAEARS